MTVKSDTTTIANLQKQIEDKDAELHRLRIEMDRANQELTNEIAHHRQTEEALRESKDQFRVLVEQIHDLVYAVTTDGIITYLNQPISRFGYSPDEVISRNFIEFVVPEQRQEVMESFNSGNRAGTSNPTEFQWLKKDGSRVWVEVVGKTQFDASGNPVLQVGMVRDISERKQREDEIRMLSLLLDTIDAECFVKDRNGYYLYINRAFEKQFGVRKQDLIGQNDSAVFDAENAAQLRANDRRIMASRQTEAIEESGWLNGVYMTYLTTKSPLVDEKGEVVGLCGAGIDITEKKRIEKELRESEYRLRVALDAAQAGWFDQSLTTDSSVWDERTIRIWGQDPATFKPSLEYALANIHPDDKDRTIALLDSALESESHDYEAEYRIVRPSGEVRWKRDQFHIFRDSEGNAVRFIGATVDITDQMHLAQALRQSEQMYRNLVERINDVLYTLEIDGTITYISPAVEAILGYAPSELMGRKVFDYMTPEALDMARLRLGMLDAGETPGFGEYELLTKAGDRRWMRISSQPIEENGRVTGIQGVMTDIHSRKLYERQREDAAVQAERERLARDLHDAVTQSLFMASATAEALPRVWLRNPEQAQKALEELRLLTRGALAEMRALLLELRPASFAEQPLGALLRQLTEGVSARSRMTVTTTVAGECSLPEHVKMAFYRIAQEALNNILKHAEASRALVSLQCDEDQGLLRIADNGKGFDLNTVAAQFGLATMRARVEDIGGEIRFKSSPGSGAEITVAWRPGMPPASGDSALVLEG